TVRGTVEIWSARAPASGDNSLPSPALTQPCRAAIWRACLIDRHVVTGNLCGEVAEWLKAADCKSARASVRWFESSPLHHSFAAKSGGPLGPQSLSQLAPAGWCPKGVQR